MDTVRPRHLQHLLVLGEQAQCRARFLAQLILKVVDQRKAGALQLGSFGFAASLRTQHVLLHGRLHGANHLGRQTLAHHVERAHHLMQVLPRNAQLARVHRGQVDAACGLRVTCVTLEGFGR